METQNLDDLEPMELSEEEQQEILAGAGNIKWLMDEYRQNYDDIEMYNRILKKQRAKQRKLAEALYDAMVAEGLEKASSQGDSAATFSPQLVKLVAINKSVEEQAFRVLEEAGQGAIIKRTVNYQTLNKVYRDGGLGSLDEGTISTYFSRWEEKKINMRRKSGTIPTEEP